MTRDLHIATPTIDNPPPYEVIDALEMELRVPLTVEEHVAKGIALAQALTAREELAAEQKARRLEMREAMADHDDVVSGLQLDVALGSELRPVGCEVVVDYARGVVETVRLDTNEVVRSRPVSDEDRQRRIR